ncbi:MAG: NAD(P)H-dependent oxidoreductase [Akkermansiaceae bacterium]
MEIITTDQLIDGLDWRYATKEFNSEKKIPAEILSQIGESLVLTPSSFGLQPWKFIIVENQEVKDSLVEHSWGQQQVANCSHLLVFCAKDEMLQEDIEAWLSCLVETRGVSRESLEGYAGMMSGFFSAMDTEQTFSWAKNQVYIALGQLMTSTALLGIDACPMEGIIKDEYDRILELKDTAYSAVVACPIGYRSENDKYAELAKARFTKKQVIKTI